MRLRVLIGFCIFLGAVSPVLLWTASGAAQQEDARDAFRRGEAAYGVGNYEQAIKEWTRAYGLDARPRIQFNLAQAYERLGRWPEAVAALKLYLEHADADDPTYPDANARLTSLQGRLSQTGLVLEGGLDGGIIKVDGKEWGRTPRPDKIPVVPGPHQIRVDWGDRPNFHASISVPPGQVVHLKVVTPEGGETKGGDPDRAESLTPVAPPDNTLSNALFIGAGGALGVAAGSLVWALNRNSEVSGCGSNMACSESDIEAIAMQSGVTAPPASDPIFTMVSTEDDVDKVKLHRLLGYVGTGVFGAAAIGLAVTGFLVREKKGQPDRATRCNLGLTGGSCTVRF